MKKQQTKTLIVIRHGNTFEPWEKPTYCGAKQDLPLAQRGHEQAKEAAQVLKGMEPSELASGPLDRHMQFIQQIANFHNLTPTISPALNEIDYGTMGGLSHEEIKIEFGAEGIEELQYWDRVGTWPKSLPWRRSYQFHYDAVGTWLKDLKDGLTIAVSSNGLIRIIGRHCTGFEKVMENGTIKVKTGHLCKLICENNVWTICNWNIPPKEFQFD